VQAVPPLVHSESDFTAPSTQKLVDVGAGGSPGGQRVLGIKGCWSGSEHGTDNPEEGLGQACVRWPRGGWSVAVNLRRAKWAMAGCNPFFPGVNRSVAENGVPVA